jgi:Cu/Zn superoxide dismutase
VHAHHLADLPSVLILPDGTAELRFNTARFNLDDLEGRAVILHAGPGQLRQRPRRHRR